MSAFLLWLADKVGSVLVLGLVGVLALKIKAWSDRRAVASTLSDYMPSQRTFTCPRCGGHEFGSARHDLSATINCQSERLIDGQPCGFVGNYDDFFPPTPPELRQAPLPTGVLYETDMLTGQPDNDQEMLGLERDARYVRYARVKSLDVNGAYTDTDVDVAYLAYERSVKATSIGELLAIDKASSASRAFLARYDQPSVTAARLAAAVHAYPNDGTCVRCGMKGLPTRASLCAACHADVARHPDHVRCPFPTCTAPGPSTT